MTFLVLIIDDDEKLNQLLTDYLGKMGFTIACLKAFWSCYMPFRAALARYDPRIAVHYDMQESCT